MKKKVIVGGIVVIAVLCALAYGLGMFDKVEEPMNAGDRDIAERNKMYAVEEKLGQERKAYLEGILAADTRGGTMPEETLEMYMEALRAGDAELAAQYYMPWEQEKALGFIEDWITNHKDGLDLYLEAYDSGVVRINNKSEHDGVVYSQYITMFTHEGDKYGYGVSMELNEINKIWKLHKEKFDTRGYK